jgi:hypothetical protein
VEESHGPKPAFVLRGSFAVETTVDEAVGNDERVSAWSAVAEAWRSYRFGTSAFGKRGSSEHIDCA